MWFGGRVLGQVGICNTATCLCQRSTITHWSNTAIGMRVLSTLLVTILASAAVMGEPLLEKRQAPSCVGLPEDIEVQGSSGWVHVNWTPPTCSDGASFSQIGAIPGYFKVDDGDFTVTYTCTHNGSNLSTSCSFEVRFI